MKETFERAIAEIIVLDETDVITTSHEYPGEEDPL